MRKFAVDCMMGKLARWLRILGYDTFFDCSIDDNQLLMIATAEMRILLTKDRELAAKGGYLVLAKSWRDELKGVVRAFHLEKDIKPFTRCPVCNGELKEIEREDAEKLVPPIAFKNATKFSICKKCGRVYWDGSHMARMKKIVEKIIKEAKDEG